MVIFREGFHVFQPLMVGKLEVVGHMAVTERRGELAPARSPGGTSPLERSVSLLEPSSGSPVADLYSPRLPSEQLPPVVAPNMRNLPPAAGLAKPSAGGVPVERPLRVARSTSVDNPRDPMHARMMAEEYDEPLKEFEGVSSDYHQLTAARKTLETRSEALAKKHFGEGAAPHIEIDALFVGGGDTGLRAAHVYADNALCEGKRPDMLVIAADAGLWGARDYAMAQTEDLTSSAYYNQRHESFLGGTLSATPRLTNARHLEHRNMVHAAQSGVDMMMGVAAEPYDTEGKSNGIEHRPELPLPADSDWACPDKKFRVCIAPTPPVKDKDGYPIKKFVYCNTLTLATGFGTPRSVGDDVVLNGNPHLTKQEREKFLAEMAKPTPLGKDGPSLPMITTAEDMLLSKASYRPDLFAAWGPKGTEHVPRVLVWGSSAAGQQVLDQVLWGPKSSAPKFHPDGTLPTEGRGIAVVCGSRPKDNPGYFDPGGATRIASTAAKTFKEKDTAIRLETNGLPPTAHCYVDCARIVGVEALSDKERSAHDGARLKVTIREYTDRKTAPRDSAEETKDKRGFTERVVYVDTLVVASGSASPNFLSPATAAKLPKATDGAAPKLGFEGLTLLGPAALATKYDTDYSDKAVAHIRDTASRPVNASLVPIQPSIAASIERESTHVGAANVNRSERSTLEKLFARVVPEAQRNKVIDELLKQRKEIASTPPPAKLTKPEEIAEWIGIAESGLQDDAIIAILRGAGLHDDFEVRHGIVSRKFPNLPALHPPMMDLYPEVKVFAIGRFTAEELGTLSQDAWASILALQTSKGTLEAKEALFKAVRGEKV